nr:MAG TPA: hypothetical protein [Caudoviricetes sp.]
MSDCDTIGVVEDYMETWPSAFRGRPFLVPENGRRGHGVHQA